MSDDIITLQEAAGSDCVSVPVFLRDYITAQTDSLSEQQRNRCLHTLSALRDCGYQCLTAPLRAHVKVLIILVLILVSFLVLV